MIMYQYKRQNVKNSPTYTFKKLEGAVEVIREFEGVQFEHIFRTGDKVQGRTLKEFHFDEGKNKGHSVYVSSEEYKRSNAQSLANQIDFLYANETIEVDSTENDILSINRNPNISSTEKDRMIKERLGQGKYRKELLNMWGGCSVTGCDTLSLLVASHIKPWSKSTSEERLCKYNGFPLIANVDKAFDSGLISFLDNGNIIISPKFKMPHVAGINQGMSINLEEKHKGYLSYHRANVFQNT